MQARGKHRKALQAVSGIAVVAALGVLGAMRHDDFQSDAQPAQSQVAGRSATLPATTGARAGSSARVCGAASAATIASVDMRVAQRIYRGELGGSEVSTDIAHISGDRELLSALASSNKAATYAAVHRLVYTPHWHIVRLRVLQRGKLLADVGGPYIIAPVSGQLRRQSRQVGSFVMSVQDDLGYQKLISRFIGVPINLYREGYLLMGTLQPAPAAPTSGQSVTVAGQTYQANVLRTLSFPSGTMQATLFLPTPTSTITARSCAAVKLAAWANIAKHIASRFTPLASHYSDLLGTIRGSTAGLAYVRNGSRDLAGGTGPGQIPRSGAVKYHGRSWSVFSWEPVPPARVYFLTPSGS